MRNGLNCHSIRKIFVYMLEKGKLCRQLIYINRKGLPHVHRYTGAPILALCYVPTAVPRVAHEHLNLVSMARILFLLIYAALLFCCFTVTSYYHYNIHHITEGTNRFHNVSNNHILTAHLPRCKGWSALPD